LNANTTGSSNTAIGFNSCAAGTTAFQNTAVGALTLQLNSTGINNVAFGWNALAANTTAPSNSAFGAGAMTSNTTGLQNSAVGRNALNANTTGNNNVAVGWASLFTMTTGENNTALGAQAGRFRGFTGTDTLTGACSSVFIGHRSRANDNSEENQVVIAGNNGLGDGSNTTVIGNTATISTRVFGTLSTNGGLCAAGLTLSGAFTGSTATFNGLIISTAGFSGTGITLSGNLSAATKSFVIPHPSKPKMRLQYGSLEGPENGVYVRGRLTGSNVIDLPDYWTDLVHSDSITVQLTAYGSQKNYFVKSIEENKITIGSKSKDIDCFYLVQAERKDVPKLKVEY
jgi:hypothetical protein